MPKRNHQHALQSSMQAELQEADKRVPTFTTDNRFDKADEILGVGKGKSQNGEQKTKASKIIRDTFSMPPEEHHERFAQLKQKDHKVGTEANKSELDDLGLERVDDPDVIRYFVDSLQPEVVQEQDRGNSLGSALELAGRPQPAGAESGGSRRPRAALRPWRGTRSQCRARSGH